MKSILVGFLITFFVWPAFGKDVESSWNNAVLFTPDTTVPVKVSEIKTDKKYPVILYLHGCTGIVDWHDHDWGRTLSSIWYIVVMPDSMSRDGRIPNCDPVRKVGGLFPQAHDYRQQEIEYALSQIKKSSWADQDRLFLMGHSEGGTAVAISQHQGFKANIILAWTCNWRGDRFLDGIHSPKNVPILAVAAKKDEWRVGRVTEGRCIDNARGRSVTQIDLDGSIHATTKYPESKPAVLNFLKNIDKLNR